MWNVVSRCGHGLVAPKSERSPQSSLPAKIFHTQHLSGPHHTCERSEADGRSPRLGESKKLKFWEKQKTPFSSYESQTQLVGELSSNMSSEIMLTQFKLICMVLS